MFIKAKQIRLWLFSIILLFCAGFFNSAYAEIPTSSPIASFNPSATFSPTTTSRIGTLIQVTVEFYSTSKIASLSGRITANGVSNPATTNLIVTQLDTNTHAVITSILPYNTISCFHYQAQGLFQVAEGIINSTGATPVTITPTVILEDGNTSVVVSNFNTNPLVDNQRPEKTGLMNVSVSGGSINSQIRKGQTVTFTQAVTTDDVKKGTLSFSNGINPITFTVSGTTLTAILSDLNFPDNVDEQITCYVSQLEDYAGNIKTYDAGNDEIKLFFDTQIPIINNVSVTNNDGDMEALAGSTLSFQAIVNNYDGDNVKVECLQNNFGSRLPMYLSLQGNPNPGQQAIFRGTMTLPNSYNTYYEAGELVFRFTATDNAGNIASTTTTFDNTVDLTKFVHSSSKVEIYSAELIKQNVATATSQLFFISRIKTHDPDNTSVVVDLTPIGATTLNLQYDSDDGEYRVFIATYTSGFTGKQLDNEYVQFQVTATSPYPDRPGQEITRMTTPPVCVDNVAPIINNFSITGATGIDGSIINKDRLTIRADVSGANAPTNPVILDLTTLDDTGIHNLNNTSTTNWQLKHTVATGSIDDDYDFILVATDNHGNINQNVLTLKVDNEPPVWVNQNAITIQQNPPYIIIGDYINLEVTLQNAPPNEGISVKVDLSQLTGEESYGIETMTCLGNVFRYSFDIATGPINNGVIFPLMITDNAGNTAIDQATGETFTASFTFLTLDQNPPDPGQPQIVLENHTDTVDKYPESINTKKTITFTLPFSKETTNDDSATATLDVTFLCKLTDGTMDYVDSVLQSTSGPTNFISLNKIGNNYKQVIIATDSVGLAEKLNYQFDFTMYDISGNKRAVRSNSFSKVDLNPPRITSIAVGSTGGSPLKIGDIITFKAYVTGNDGMPPTIDLTSLNLGEKNMNYDSPGVYSYDVTIESGQLDNEIASWAITAFDGCDNSVTSYTREITIDNKPPEISTFYVTADTISLNQRINYTDNSVTAGSLTFRITASEPLTVTLDLTAIGGSATQPAAETIDGPNYIYTYQTKTNRTSEEFTNYRFEATIKDANNNQTTVYSQLIKTIDCEIPIINEMLCGYEVTGRSTELLDPQNTNILRIGDTIKFYASMSACLDTVASISISINPGIATLSKEMIYNDITNRHEIEITIKAPSIIENGATWGSLNLNKINYIISAADDAANIAIPTSGITTYVVKNVYPTIASYSLAMSPDFLTKGILNVASGTSRTTRDNLIASATLANNDKIATASIDLTNIGGSNLYYIASITGSIVSNEGNGIDVASFSILDYTNVSIPITIIDEAGYTCNATHDLKIDTKIPEITSIDFDGERITIYFSEDIFSIKRDQWKLVGSATVPIGTTAKLNLADESLASWSEFIDNVEIKLGLLGKKEVTNWASQPLYFEVARIPSTAAATDQYGNWIASYSFFPVNITDYSWREDPSIINFTMTHNWPNQIYFDIQFNQEMDPSTFVASDAIIYIDVPNNVGNEFDDVSYDGWYVIQQEDVCNWIDSKNLRITLCDNGRDWVASNLTNNSSKMLKFVQRSASRRMVQGIFDKLLKLYTISSPYYISDNRQANPLSALNILSDPKPIINLASATITLNFNDRAKLFNDSFRTINEINPTMGIPTPHNTNGSDLHLNKISLFNIETNQSILLNCGSITADLNVFASSTVRIKLTQTDVDKILDFYNTNSVINWGLQIKANSFTNLWGISNTAYKPSSPGTVEVVQANPTEDASIIDVAVSDMPPTKDDAGNFIFEFELNKIKAGEIYLPFSTIDDPTAGIFETSTGDRIASGTFVGWSTRTVKNIVRTVATFKTSEPFTKDVDGVAAELRIYGLKDIFGNESGVKIASYVYDISKKDNNVVSGFITASAAFIVDNVKPTMTAFSPSLIGITNPGTDKFYIDYSEEMDTSSIPSVSLATGSNIISLSFIRWENSNTRAVFSNNQAITEYTPNGTWVCRISGGQDLAGNAYDSSESNVTIKSAVPQIVANSMKLYSIRDTININTIVTDKPLSFDSSKTYSEIGFQYLSASTENTPHKLVFYNSANEIIGSATVVQSGVYATATINISNFETIPSYNENITIKILDTAGNISTSPVGSFDYYRIAPTVSNMSLSGVATLSQGIYYYTTSLGDMTFTANFASSYANPLNLLIASYSTIPMSNIATLTHSTKTLSGLTYTDSFGTGLDDNLYLITFADEAGNLTNGASPLMLVVDNTPPTIANIVPGSTDKLSSTKIGMATFTVTFNELMDTTVTPNLILATSTAGATINTKFVGWGNDMMTASFTNTVAIVATYPSGTYEYKLTNAKDLSGNLISKTTTPFTTIVQPQGPGVATFTVLTLQPDINDTVFENRSFNPFKYQINDAGSVTFKIEYVSGPFETPHKLLIYNESNENIATLTVTEGNPGYATWDSMDIPKTNATYSFRMLDKLGNFGPEKGYLPWKFRTDLTTPSFTSISFNDGGIGQTVGGIRYYSPTVPATFTVTTTTEKEDLVLIASSTATETYILPATSSYSISFGSQLSNGNVSLFVSDLAGNINNTASISLFVDNITPQVTFAQCVDNADNPLTIIGKTATVLVTFDKIMNKNIVPTVQIATDTTLGTKEVATLTFSAWRDDYNAVFVTNNVFETINYPCGTSSIIVSMARDLAGNFIATGSYGDIEVISQNPSFFASLVSQQLNISGDSLNDNPLSLKVEPNVATLTISYNPVTNDPHGLDHTLMLFNGAGIQIATHTLTNGATNITINPAFFGDSTAQITPPAEISATFTVKIKDSVGNISSPQNPFEINYDSISPKVNNFKVDGVSTASTLITYYYNPDLIGSLTSDILLNASDALKLVVYGVSSSPYEIIATRTYETKLTNLLTYTYNGKLNYLGTALPEGTYKIAAIDMAGNFAESALMPGMKAEANLIIDKTPPAITVATITNAIHLSSGDVGMATFTVQFNESMFGDAYQYLEIATTSYKIPCRFVRLETTTFPNDTAVFETAVSVGTQILQGQYVYHIVGTDLTGNRVEQDFGEIFVKSKGPSVRSINTFSYQQTTASDTLISGNEYHYNEAFSFNIEPRAATMSIVLSELPDGNQEMIYVNFLKKVTTNQQTTENIVASYPVNLDSNLMATFTWDTTKEPTVTTTETYIIRISDSNGDMSYYSYNWTNDSEAPTYSNITFNSGVNIPESGIVYLNPYRHTNFEVTFKNVRDLGPKLRVTSNISTDTYPLTSLSNYSWKTAFRGKYSRDTGNPDELMPDGIYNIGLVDQAGNTAASGTTEILYQMVIDTVAPEITSFTLKVNGVNVGNYCSPNDTNPLVVSLDTTEILSETGAYYLDVYNSGNVLINRINLVDNGGTLEASWNGKNSTGTVVSDGTYTFRVSDICGNSSTNTVSTTAVTSPFQVMNPAVQISFDTVKIWFNHGIDSNSIGIIPITSTPPLTISNVHVEDERALVFKALGMTHGGSYTLTVNDSIRNLYGSTLTASSAVFYADVKGPAIVGTSFNGVSNQGEIYIQFDQTLDRVSAENISSYNIRDSSGYSVPLATAILQPDNTTVLICVSGAFTENANYTIKAPGVKDELGNSACETALSGFSFKGRDLTPPTFVISAFSNAANENDIIVIAVSNEELIRVPTLTINHGYASPITLTMQKNASNNLTFMAATSLKASNGQTGTLKVEGEDLNGNIGSSYGSFVIAAVKTNSSLRLSSNDKQFSLVFDKNSLKSDATVKILQRPIIKDQTATGTIQTLLQNEYASMKGIRASVSVEEESTNSELTPITDAYETSVLSNKINKGITASLKVPESASQTTGLGLFYQKNGSWKFVSSNITNEKEIKAKLTSSQILAIMQDSVAPSIKLDESLDLSKAFETPRPEFLGNIKDLGSGLDTNSLEAKIDNNTQSISVDNKGNFKFKSLSELINGNHELTISAKDRTGNRGTTGSMRFALVLPFEFKQIVQYPNPARNNVTIRIRTNSTGINCNIRIKIYDVAGHKVADFDENDVRDRGDGNYEVRWDLCNKKGKKVANGAYLARLEAINPETGKKIKSTLKIAVLK